MSSDDIPTLLARVRARLDEDERVARAAIDERSTDWWWGDDAESPAERHIARHNPRRTITAVVAMTELLDILEHEFGSTGSDRAMHAALSALDRIGDDRG